MLGNGTYCEPHAKQRQSEHSKRRGSSTARGYDYAWQKLRRRKLQTDPLCQPCKTHGKTTLAEEVDHIIRVSERPDLRLDWDNLQSICQDCHAAKSASERMVGTPGPVLPAI